MKYFQYVLFAMVFMPGISHPSFAQHPCANIFADLKKGTINDVSSGASMKVVKKKLPCFTGSSDEKIVGLNCGGGVFFLNHNFFFYTGRNYIEIRSGFKGTLSIEVMGKNSQAIEELLGKPNIDRVIDEFTIYCYKRDYGTLRLTFSKGLVTIIGIHNTNLGDTIADVANCL